MRFCLGIKIDFWTLGTDDFEQSKFKRRRGRVISGQKISIIAPEDLILTKLIWCKELPSERHLRDCVGIWKVQEGKLDRDYLFFWAKKLSVTDLLEKISRLEY